MTKTLLSSVAALALAVPAWAAPGHDMGAVGEALGAGNEAGGEASAEQPQPEGDEAATAQASQDPAPVIPSTDRLPEDASPFADQELGRSFTVREDELPEPYADPASRNPALTIKRGEHMPEAPEGFEVTLFAQGLTNPRQMYVLPNGDVLLAQQSEGIVTLLRDTDGDGEADTISRFAQGFEGPYGLARMPEDAEENAGDILVADHRGVWRMPFTMGEIRASGPEMFAPERLEEVPKDERHAQLPMDHFPVTEQGVFGGSEGHNTRSLVVSPDGETMYVGVGSAGNIAIEEPPRATIQAFDLGGGDQRTFADGTRNPIGVGFRPGTDELWAIVQERDGLGNELVPDFLTRVEEGDFYGWPYAYTGSNPQPQFASLAPEGLIEEALVGDVLFEGHSAAMDFAFAPEAFGEAYVGDAFVALKGSWNRADPTGYKVVRVPFEDGEPTGSYENFLVNFWVEGDDRAVVWGRPADVAFMPDGAMLVADDTGGTIWHVAPTSADAQAEGGAEADAPASDG